MDRALAHAPKAKDFEYPSGGGSHDINERPGERQKNVHWACDRKRHLLGTLQSERFRDQLAEDHVHQRDHAESDHNGDPVGVNQDMRQALQEMQPLDEVGDHWLADPAERQADNGYAELDAGHHFVQIAMKALQDSGADTAGANQLFNSRFTDPDQREFGCGKEGIGCDQGHDQQDPEQHKSNHLEANFNIPKLVFRFEQLHGTI